MPLSQRMLVYLNFPTASVTDKWHGTHGMVGGRKASVPSATVADGTEAVNEVYSFTPYETASVFEHPWMVEEKMVPRALMPRPTTAGGCALAPHKIPYDEALRLIQTVPDPPFAHQIVDDTQDGGRGFLVVQIPPMALDDESLRLV